MTRSLPLRRPDAAFLAACFLGLLALALRLYALGDPSVSFFDELTTLIKSLEPTALDVIRASARQYPPYVDFQPPLYYLIVHAAIAFGHTDALARLPAALAGAASIPLLYCVGKRLGGRACGLFAAAALAANLHHIDASQQARLYAFFALCALAAVGSLLAALDGNGGKPAWVVFFLAMVAGLYTSYLTAATIVAVGGLTLLCLLWPMPDSLRPRAALTGLAVTLAGVALAFWPWIAATAPLRALLLTPAAPDRPALPAALTLFFGPLASHYAAFLGRPEHPWLLAGPALLGLLAGLSGRRRRGAVIALVWFVAFFGLVWLRANATHHFQARYLLPCLFPVLILGGFAAAPLADLAGRMLPKGLRSPVRLTLAALLGLALAWPNLPSLPFYYRRDDSRLKTLAAFLRNQAGPGTGLALWGAEGGWSQPYFQAFRQWYLPGVFEPAIPEKNRASRQCLVLVPLAAGQPPLPGPQTPLATLARVVVARQELASTAPVLALPDAAGRFTFTAGWSPTEAFAQVYDSQNVVFGPTGATLSDRSRPGRITYALTALPGCRLTLTALHVDGSALGVPGQPTTGGLRVLAGPDQDSLIPYDPSHPPAPSPNLILRLDLDPGPEARPVTFRGLAASLLVAGNPEATPEVVQAERLAANTEIVPLRPHTLHPGRRPLAAATAEEAATLCPATAPVLTIGATRYLDPAQCPDAGLAGPDVPLTLENPGPAALPIAKVRLSGHLDAPTLTFGDGAPLHIPLAGPTGTVADLGRDGRGTISLTPLFTASGPPAGAEAATVVTTAADPALTCPDAKPCQLAYAVVSGLPVHRLRLTWFPRIFSDPAGKNAVIATVSTDGRTFAPLDALRSSGSGRWEGLGVTRQARVDLGGFTGTLRLRFTFTGDGAQLWSSPEYPMALALGLDTRSLALPPELPPGRTRLAVSPESVLVGIETPKETRLP